MLETTHLFMSLSVCHKSILVEPVSSFVSKDYLLSSLKFSNIMNVVA